MKWARFSPTYSDSRPNNSVWLSDFHDISVHLLNLLSYNWICNANIWVLACHCDMAAKGSRVRFLFLIFSLVPSKILPSRGTETNKSWTILQNFNSWMIKLAKTSFFPNCQVANVFLFFLTVNQELKFYKTAKLFLRVSSSRERFFERTWENNKHKNRA